jgi:predicted membrane channel-forming protein YqfA (hemolysin III family)
MTEQNEFQHSLHPQSLGERAWQGAGIALVLLAIFLLSPEDIDYGVWVILPMITVSVGGALGGIFHYLMDRLRCQGGWKKMMANIFSILVYILLLWLSLVAALNVTGHWD